MGRPEGTREQTLAKVRAARCHFAAATSGNLSVSTDANCRTRTGRKRTVCFPTWEKESGPSAKRLAFLSSSGGFLLR